MSESIVEPVWADPRMQATRPDVRAVQVVIKHTLPPLLSDESRRDLQARLVLLACRKTGKTGGRLLRVIDLRAPPHSFPSILREVRGHSGGSVVTIERVGTAHYVVWVETAMPVGCRAILGSKGYCETCPAISAGDNRGRWIVVLPSPRAATELVRRLSSRKRALVTVARVGPQRMNASLTARQFSALTLANHEGFYEFPRRVNLSRLATMFGVRPATMSQILRAAEEKVLAKFIEDPFLRPISANP